MTQQPDTTLFRLMHHKVGPDDDEMELDPEDEKEIGIFSTEEKAREAIAVLQDKPGFRKWPGGFRILFDKVDEIGWSDGFFTPGVDDLDEIAASRGEKPGGPVT